MTLTISTQRTNTVNKPRSGHFATNEVSDENDVVDKVAKAHGIEGISVTDSQPSTMSDEQQKFDASLSKLFGCIKLAYKDRVKMTAPKIRAYKGVKMTKKDKIRLNNIVWRDWHEQFVKHKKPRVCHFTGAANFENQHKEAGDLLEGQYWKRRIDVIKREYMKWRVFNKAKIKGRGEWQTLTSEEQLLEQVAQQKYQVTSQKIVSQDSPESQNSSEEPKVDMTNDIFDTLQLIGFHHPTLGAGAEFLSFDHLNIVQPSLVGLEPDLEFGELDTAEPFQDMLAEAVNLHMGNINTYLPGQKRPFNESSSTPPPATTQQYTSLEPPPPYCTVKRSRSLIETELSASKPDLESSLSLLNTTQPHCSIQTHAEITTQSNFVPPLSYNSIPQTFTSTVQSSLPQQIYPDTDEFGMSDGYMPNSERLGCMMPAAPSKNTTATMPQQMSLSTGHGLIGAEDHTSLQDLVESAFKDSDDYLFKPPEPPDIRQQTGGPSSYLPQLVKQLTQSNTQRPTYSAANTSQVSSTGQFIQEHTCTPYTTEQSNDYSSTWVPPDTGNFYSPTESSISSLTSPVQTPTSPEFLTLPKTELMSPTDSENFTVPHSTTETTSEQRRRQAIKNSFQTLSEILPNVNSATTNKASNATILIKANEFITQQTEEQTKRQSEIEFLKQEVDALTSAISISQGQLPVTGIPAHSSHHEVMKKMFNSYVNDQIKRNWKFYIFSKMAEPMFNSFCPAVNSSTVDELYRSSQAWLDQHCNLPALRGSALQAMRDVSGETSILSQPSALPEQARSHILK